jgi:DNA (cytosine-5)-methyltransferase 1
MEPLPWVFNRMGRLGSFKLVFSCEKEPRCRQLIAQCLRVWGPRSAQGNTKHVMLEDITTRDPKQLPDHDLYVAGFPCQPFSNIGLRKGVADPHGRGRIINHIVAALEAKQPRAFILENVQGLISTHKETFACILKKLRTIAGKSYAVSWRLLNTKDHGIPQNRSRVYIVGIRKEHLAKGTPQFKWPAPVPAQNLASFLEDDVAGAKQREAVFLAGAAPGTTKKLRQLLRKVHAAGGKARARKHPYVFDLDGSKPHSMKGCCPCITRARGSTGFYLPSRGRRMTVGERLRLQGLPQVYLRGKCRQGISDRQLGQMIGNAMSGNVLERLLARLLPACGLSRV